MEGANSHEAHVPAGQPAAEKNRRLPGADVTPGGRKSFAARRQRAEASLRNGQRQEVTVPRGNGRVVFPASQRLCTDREFREVVRKGARLHTTHYTVYRDYLGRGKTPGGNLRRETRGDAVARNRAKRLLREFYRMHKNVFPMGTRTAIVVRKPPEGAVLASVCAELLPALRRRWGGEGDPRAGPTSPHRPPEALSAAVSPYIGNCCRFHPAAPST